MSRKKVVLSFIKNDADRKASFKKRKRGLLKKAQELSILCDVLVCLIIFSPYDPEPEVWPSRDEAIAVLERFNSLPEMDRERKMIDMTSFARQRIKKLQDQLNRIRKANTRKAVESYMYGNIAGLNDKKYFDVIRHGSEMNSVIAQTLRSIRAQKELKKRGEGCSSASNGSTAAAEFIKCTQHGALPFPDSA